MDSSSGVVRPRGRTGARRGHDRRGFFKGAGAVLGAAAGTGVPGAALAFTSVPVFGTSIDVRDDRFRAVIPDPNTLIERVAGGFRFVEGPVWLESSILFVDNQLNAIFRFRDQPWGPEITTYRFPAGFPIDQPRPAGVGGYGPNGLAVDPQGRILVTEHGNRRITRTEPDGTLTVIATHFGDKRLNSPNDMAVRSDGTIYFTDPPYGLAMQSVGKELDYQGIYRIDPAGQLHLEGQWNRPNGLALSPDEKRLYVVDSVEHQARAYDVRPDGSLMNERLFADVKSFGPNGGPDGVKCDSAGNFYLTGMKEDNNPAGPGTVMVFEPDGALLGRIILPERPVNCGFGGADGKTLYMTARSGLYRVRTAIAGMPPIPGGRGF
ncbi:MAG: Gluconolactonase [uncultured Chloroflexi bacterium]|uniref:Gluconolactonase n=1 Tax=uncultured Chloroflexota bacterium TaxID=166587 RepID=A0A6J4IHP5_9CHLR|nr:MAG: Gluconolactonase [uncultured Chloroflexota bacterium]